MTHQVLLYLVSYGVMYLCFPIYNAMFGWDVPLRVDPHLLAMFLLYRLVVAPALAGMQRVAWVFKRFTT